MDTFRGLTLHPFQRRAIDAVRAGRSVIVAAPTGAGKTLVADFAIEHALAAGERIVYTSPVKALSNQKFRDFREQFRDDVGIMTGDVTINAGAPLLIMTTEVFRNTLFEDPRQLEGTVWTVFDEIHYIDDAERGTVWEESIIFAPDHIRFLCLSATVPNVRELAAWISEVREEPVEVVESHDRPVPLRHYFHVRGDEIVPLKEARERLPRLRKGKGRPADAVRSLLDLLERRNLLPCLYFCFSRKDCERLAHANARRDLLTKQERERILGVFEDLRERYQLAEDRDTERLRAAASRGCMHHHAGLLPIVKEIVERLFTTGLVKLLFTTETFALGVNMPARTVVFHMLKKYDGVAFDWLRTRDYFQMAGRAGRQGMDEVGHVISRLDPRWDDPAAAVKVVKSPVEAVRSRFNLSYSGLLSLYDRVGEDVRLAYDRSFARFQRLRRKGQRARERRRESTPREARVIEQRLRVLRYAGYLDRNGLTGRGRFACLLNGYEVQATELFAHGIFHLCDETRLAILMTAVVYEERKGDSSARVPPGVLAEIPALALDRVQAFRRVEFEEGLTELVKEPDFRIAAPVLAWTRGEPLVRVREQTSISDGDLVRYLRMAIQLMRQVRNQVHGEGDLAERFATAIRLLDRDEVDARRQLELG